MTTVSESIFTASISVLELVANRLKAITSNLPLNWLTDSEDTQLTQIRRFTGQLVDRLSADESSSTGVETKEQAELRYAFFLFTFGLCQVDFVAQRF